MKPDMIVSVSFDWRISKFLGQEQIDILGSIWTIDSHFMGWLCLVEIMPTIWCKESSRGHEECSWISHICNAMKNVQDKENFEKNEDLQKKDPQINWHTFGENFKILLVQVEFLK